MPRVQLKSPALLTVAECRNLERDGQRNFSLALLDEDGDIEKFIDVKDSRYPARVRRPAPAYYPLHILIDLDPGDYMLFAGSRYNKQRRYFRVDMLGICEIKSPSDGRGVLL